ncbi:MAG: type II secretion system F family protein, partial [Kiritimatiellae bacterium]|nr:type II secretion system F family protein [Kiritimatiellia bacterium]
MLFAYRGYTASGADARGTVDAPDAREAARLLEARGVFARSIAAPRPPRPLRAPARAALYRGLGALLAAG